MKTPTMGALGLGLSLVMLSADPVRADFVHRFLVGQPSSTVRPGESFAVDVLLEETVTGGDSPRLTGTGNGLISAGARAVFGPSAPAQVLPTDDILPDTTAFTSPLFLLEDLPGDGTAGFLESIDFGDSPVSSIPVGFPNSLRGFSIRQL